MRCCAGRPRARRRRRGRQGAGARGGVTRVMRRCTCWASGCPAGYRDGPTRALRTATIYPVRCEAHGRAHPSPFACWRRGRGLAGSDRGDKQHGPPGAPPTHAAPLASASPTPLPRRRVLAGFRGMFLFSRETLERSCWAVVNFWLTGLGQSELQPWTRLSIIKSVRLNC